MTFEERIRGEKASIGYSVSGHGLDGLKPFIDRRVIGKEHVVEFLKKLSEREEFLQDEDTDVPGSAPLKPTTESQSESVIPEDANGNPKKKEREKMIRVRFVGLVSSIRKIQTKTGKLMAVATCDSTDFRFSTVVFPKDYELLGPILEEDKVLLVEGNLKCDLDSGEISVIATSLKSNTITAIRSQAQEMQLFDAKFHVSYYISAIAPETLIQAGTTEASKKAIRITVPKSASKQDLLDLKHFLSKQANGTIRVFLDIQEQRIDTKMLVENQEVLQKWMSERWKNAKIQEDFDMIVA